MGFQIVVVDWNQTLVVAVASAAMVELRKEKLEVDLEMKRLEVLFELKKMEVLMALVVLFVDNQVDFQELVLFGLRRGLDRPWLVEKVEVRQMVLV